MESLMSTHPILVISVIGSIIGTILYKLPFTHKFARDVLCANDYFCPGNFGLCVFIHGSFTCHLLGNLFTLIPSLLLCEGYYSKSLMMTSFIGMSIFDGLACWIRGKGACGISSVAFMYLSMACLRFFNGLSTALLIMFFVYNVKSDAKDYKTDSFAHISGFIIGAIIGVIANLAMGKTFRLMM